MRHRLPTKIIALSEKEQAICPICKTVITGHWQPVSNESIALIPENECPHFVQFTGTRYAQMAVFDDGVNDNLVTELNKGEKDVVQEGTNKLLKNMGGLPTVSGTVEAELRKLVDSWKYCRCMNPSTQELLRDIERLLEKPAKPVKTIVYCWHGSTIEKEATEKAGYEHNGVYNEDPFEVAKKIQAQGKVFVAISPITKSEEIGDNHIVGISDDWFRQR